MTRTYSCPIHGRELGEPSYSPSVKGKSYCTYGDHWVKPTIHSTPTPEDTTLDFCLWLHRNFDLLLMEAAMNQEREAQANV